MNKVGLFTAETSRWNSEKVHKDQWGNEIFDKIEQRSTPKTSNATAKTGRLRLVRSGPTLYFYTSEDDTDFSLLHQSEFGTKDLKNVRILAGTGWVKANYDVRITDLQIRAEGFPKEIAAPPLPAPETASTERRWLVAVLALTGLSVVSVGLLGVWLYARRRRGPPPTKEVPVTNPARVIGFKCSGCEKRLKVKMELAGKKLKCPHCSKVVVVPSIRPKNPEEQP